MPERQRAYRGEEVVTVLKGKPGSRGKVEIRNAFGFTEAVPGKSLKAIPADEPVAKLRFGEAED
jgi:hypothetical protein